MASKKKQFNFIVNNTNGEIDVIENTALNQSARIIFLMKFVGLLPLTRNRTLLSFKLWETVCLYSLMVYAIVMFYVTKRLKYSFNFFADERCDFNCQTFEFIIIILSLQVVLIPVSFWRRIKHIVGYFTAWQKFQADYIYYSKTKLIISKEPLIKKLIYILFFTSIVLTSIICVLFYDLDFSTETFLTYFFVSFYTNIATGFWFVQCNLIHDEAKNVQMFFNQLIETSKNSTLDVVPIFFKLWSELNEILQSLSSGFTFLISLICFTSFLSALASAYCLVSQIFSRNTEFNQKLAVLNLVLSVWMLSVLYLLNDSSFKVTNQVDFRNWIVTIDINKLNGKSQDQIPELLSYFETQVPEITLFEFELLSREFLVTISSTLITYIIIILQFRSGDVNTTTPKQSSEYFNNSNFQHE